MCAICQAKCQIIGVTHTSYGTDYYSVKENKTGCNNVITIIDLITDNLVLHTVKGRSAFNTDHSLLYRESLSEIL